MTNPAPSIRTGLVVVGLIFPSPTRTMKRNLRIAATDQADSATVRRTAVRSQMNGAATNGPVTIILVVLIRTISAPTRTKMSVARGIGAVVGPILVQPLLRRTGRTTMSAVRGIGASQVPSKR